MRLQKEKEIQPMLNQLKNRYRQWQYRRICRTLQLPPQLIQDLPTLANQTQQSGAAVQQLQTTMQQTLSRLQQDDLTTLSLLERVTKLERAASSQGSHNMDLNMLMKTTYSQSGEDAILAYLFAVLGIPFAKCTYLDLGANRPKEMSNTYFFYEQGATGTLIEANPALIPALQKERSGDVILNRCIAPKSGDVIPFHVMNVDGLSTPEDVTELLANHPDLKLLETVNVETVSVNDLFAQMHAVPVFVNIDRGHGDGNFTFHRLYKISSTGIDFGNDSLFQKAASWTEKSGDSGIFAGKRLCGICLYRNQFHFY